MADSVLLLREMARALSLLPHATNGQDRIEFSSLQWDEGFLLLVFPFIYHRLSVF